VNDLKECRQCHRLEWIRLGDDGVCKWCQITTERDEMPADSPHDPSNLSKG